VAKNYSKNQEHKTPKSFSNYLEGEAWFLKRCEELLAKGYTTSFLSEPEQPPSKKRKIDEGSSKEAEEAKEEEEEKEQEGQEGKQGDPPEVKEPSKMSTEELDQELEKRGLPQEGKKDTKIARLALDLLCDPGNLLAGEHKGHLGYIMGGGVVLRDNFFYQDLRGISSRRTKLLWEELERVSDEEFKRRFDPERMMEKCVMGPPSWSNDDLGYLLENFHALKAFLKIAVEQERGLLIYVG